jgi:cobalamin biosynthesis Mg chelatase CobN
MADDGFTGTGAGEPLAAAIAEQLRAKSELERQAEAARAAGDQLHERVERRKSEERHAVEEHLAPYGADSPEGWHAAKAAARRSGGAGRARPGGAAEHLRAGAGLPVVPLVAALAVLALPRTLRWLVALPLVIGLWVRSAPAR